jgi:hypothetical protein
LGGDIVENNILGVKFVKKIRRLSKFLKKYLVVQNFEKNILGFKILKKTSRVSKF